MTMKTFKLTKNIVIIFILITLGMIMIISSFFINDAQCDSIFTSSFTIFAVGMLFLMIGFVLGDVEYRQQNKLKKKKRSWIDVQFSMDDFEDVNDIED